MRFIKGVLVLSLVFLCSSMVMHPLKLSTTDVAFHKGRFQVKTKMFTDDLDMTLRGYANTPSLDLINKGFDKATLAFMHKYYKENFKISSGGRLINLNGIKVSFSETKEVVYVEALSEPIELTTASGLKIRNTLLFRNIPEQKNIVNIDSQGKGSFDKTILFKNEEGDTEKVVE